MEFEDSKDGKRDVTWFGLAWLGLREGTSGFGSWHGVMAVNEWRVLEGRLPRSVWGCGSCMHAWMEGVAGLAHASAPFQSFVFSLRCHLLYIEQALHLMNEPIEIGKKLR